MKPRISYAHELHDFTNTIRIFHWQMDHMIIIIIIYYREHTTNAKDLNNANHNDIPTTTVVQRL